VGANDPGALTSVPFAGWQKHRKHSKDDKEVQALAPEAIWNYFNDDGHECGCGMSLIQLRERGFEYEEPAVEHFILMFTNYFNQHDRTKMPYVDFRAAFDQMTVRAPFPSSAVCCAYH
jgi:hypothetical protein